jgi:hypothetical protein
MAMPLGLIQSVLLFHRKKVQAASEVVLLVVLVLDVVLTVPWTLTIHEVLLAVIMANPEVILLAVTLMTLEMTEMTIQKAMATNSISLIAISSV